MTPFAPTSLPAAIAQPADRRVVARPAGQRSPFMTSLVAMVLLGAFSALGCSSTPPPPPDGLRNPRGMALACVVGGVVKPLNACPNDSSIRTYITGGSIGSVAIADPIKGLWIDTNASIPGFTPLMIGDLPGAIVPDPTEPKWLYMTLALGGDVVRMDVSDPTVDSLKRIKLPFVPADLAASVTPTGRLYFADTAAGAIWRIDTADFETGGKPTKIDIGGSPRDLTAVSQTGHLYVAHRDHAHVTVVSMSDDSIVARISLGPACRDGLDNDGDGKTDAADSGCDGRDDRIEGDPEVGANCADGKDNDGDGDTDADDAGCASGSTIESCRDGVDNDGDGFTDFPEDPGCVSFASMSEAWDAPSCGDGVDNDGDGQTDAADSSCADTNADTELPSVKAGVKTACNDGIDNDNDGKTDTEDGDCPTATGDGEQRLPCSDGVDNDGDGKTDLEDSACTHRGTASEVASDDAPISSVAATFDGKWVVVTHRLKRAAYVIDTATRALAHPGVGAKFRRPSTLDARDGVDGVALGGQPLAIAPVVLVDRQAMAISLQLGGLFLLTFDAEVAIDPPPADDTSPKTELKQLIGLEPASKSSDVKSKAGRPTLTVEGKVVDMGTKPPRRHANFGSLNEEHSTDAPSRYFGFLFGEDDKEHRAEFWQIRAQGQIPGSERSLGRLRSSDELVDPTADFCRLGVVAGDLLLIHRGAEAADCAGLTSDTLQYRIVSVGPTSLKLDTSGGVVDAPITMDNQLNPPTPTPVPLPSAACLSRDAIHYEVRAAGWLVRGSRSGLLSSRGRLGATCAPWSNTDPNQAARITSATLQVGADAKTMSCPLAIDDAKILESQPYGGGAAAPLTPFENLIWSGTLLPGCAPSDVPGEAPSLLPPVRDVTWNYTVTPGFSPAKAIVGSSPVAIISGAALKHVWVVDQGGGALYSVELDKNFSISHLLN